MAHFLAVSLLFALSGVASAYSTSDDEMKEAEKVECPAGVTLDFEGKCISLADCTVAVLHDKATGWEDDCEGLTEMPGNHTEAECKDTCYKDVNCAVWQFSNYEDGVLKAPETFCYTGIPNKDCQTRTSPVNFTTLGGQRVQRGSVNVKAPALGVQVMGLKPFLMQKGTVEEQQERCKLHCYSDLSCNVWQYEVFEGAKSCWIEKDTVPTGVENKTNAFSKRVSAGEYITHYCAVATPKDLPWPWIIAGIILGLIALGAIIFLLQPKPKVKKTRAVKIAEKPEPPVPLFFIPQPTYLIPQPVQQVVQPSYSVVQQSVPVQQAVEYSVVQQSVPVQQTVVQSATPMTIAQSTPLLSAGGSVSVPTMIQ